MDESEHDELRELLAGMSDEELRALGGEIGIQINPSRPLAGLSNRELREKAAADGLEIEVSDDPISPEEAIRVAKLVPASSLPEDEAGLLSSSAEENREVSIPLPGLVRARDLIASEDLDQGDFEPGGLYKGFQILPREQWPPVSDITPDPEKGIVGHANQTRRFYVVSPLGTIGLVPWEGSQVVWPWEQAWRQDLYRPEVQTFLKDDREGKKK